ncbi:LysR family transcriptional regulator [Myxococcota bacterium]|nr:LysR family transcriptional regulator [Myxococcota bacterium]
MEDPLDPADMLLFVAVVREGGFTSAARSLGLSKQRLSQRIARLEEALGVRLLERTTRTVRPTEAGLAYFQRCQAIEAQIAEANDEARERHAQPVGTLRISAPVLFGRRLLAPIVREFMARHPRVRVELLLADRQVDLIAEGFDLAIRVGPLDDSSLSARLLTMGRVVFVASPALLAAHPTRPPDSLGELPCVGMRTHETWSFGGRSVRVEPRLVVNDLELVLAAVVDGLGVARLPTLVCGAAIRAGQLQVLHHEGDDGQRPVHLVTPSRRRSPARVRAFVELLAAWPELRIDDDGAGAPESAAQAGVTLSL